MLILTGLRTLIEVDTNNSSILSVRLKLAFRKLLILLCFALPQVADAEQYWVPDTRPPQFCLQNFNAYGPIYASKVEERSEMISSFLQWIPKCEVVHLQEVWNDSQIDIFERNLSRQYNISSPNRQAKIGLMSMFMADVKSEKTLDFSINHEGGVLDTVRSTFNVKKAFHAVRSQFFGIEEDFYFVNTHLHPSSPAVRMTQILDILRWRLANQDAKLILSGDFNADIGSIERQMVMLALGVQDAMAEFFGGTYPAGYCTYCTGNPLGWTLTSYTFDYVFFSNIGQASTTLKVENGQVNMRGTPRKPWSDHFGVRVHFSVLPETRTVQEYILNQRRDQTIRMLTDIQVYLKKQEPLEFIPYVVTVEDMIKQLKTRRGVFNQYFEKYR